VQYLVEEDRQQVEPAEPGEEVEREEQRVAHAA
jgi:hypothetical protein